MTEQYSPASDDRPSNGRALADRLFLGSDDGNRAYLGAVEQAAEAVVTTVGEADDPYTGRGYRALRDHLDGETIPETGAPLSVVLDEVATDVLANSVVPSDEACVAHLQCPPMVPGLAAEMLLTAVNQSMDSFDQAPAATVIEERVIDDLADLFSLGDAADGVMTSGGTQSNFQGLLLARNRYVADRFDRSARANGLPPAATDMRVLCSEHAHFTAAQGAAHLGLGEDAVVSVPTDRTYRMDPEALRTQLERMKRNGERPFALFATAGTTDFGSIDPLEELADIAAEHDLWYHVDAAYGGALAVSDEHRSAIAGIERADSLSVDFHKLFYQPISCGAFLLREGDDFDLMARHAAYLNPDGDDAPHRVEKSTLTTRRFDALKPYIAFRTVGRKGLEALVDRSLSVATRTAELVRADDAYELVCDPTLNVVTFRYQPSNDHPELADGEWSDRLNREIREFLFDAGEGIVARTTVEDRVTLKLTLLNPRTTVDDIRTLLERGQRHAATVEAAELGTAPVETERGNAGGSTDGVER
ncbi:2,4-diaminobutyrate decarboxylase (plasmid) [Halostagnicola larsenii XH-48]|uniref:2,4-diaminobutyrate decarboxylase n=1 Tax=Halostagnicola larsenii XH-48 TaxID=797299 RepID=W0JRZ3_9EURY|nr:aspartate aminotransferase family protein [Halostagnicola larsenii]AHG01476.1 2,4-diaminobutyrate decarboxylase [Halostagnicola larsenii XH-48]